MALVLPDHVSPGDSGHVTDTNLIIDALAALDIRTSSYSADLAAGTTVTVTHGLGTADVVVAVYRTSDGVEVDVPFARISTNALTLNSAVDLAGHRIVILAGR